MTVQGGRMGKVEGSGRKSVGGGDVKLGKRGGERGGGWGGMIRALLAKLLLRYQSSWYVSDRTSNSAASMKVAVGTIWLKS